MATASAAIAICQGTIRAPKTVSPRVRMPPRVATLSETMLLK